EISWVSRAGSILRNRPARKRNAPPPLLTRTGGETTSTRLRKAMAEQQPGRLVLVRAEESPAPAEIRSDPGAGQIRIVRPDRGRDMQVLIVEVHDEYVQGMLCGEECDLATDTDSILEPDVT